eukprot:767950-Hanusia_phi.AAC.1
MRIKLLLRDEASSRREKEEEPERREKSRLETRKEEEEEEEEEVAEAEMEIGEGRSNLIKVVDLWGGRPDMMLEIPQSSSLSELKCKLGWSCSSLLTSSSHPLSQRCSMKTPLLQVARSLSWMEWKWRVQGDRRLRRILKEKGDFVTEMYIMIHQAD